MINLEVVKQIFEILVKAIIAFLVAAVMLAVGSVITRVLIAIIELLARTIT